MFVIIVNGSGRSGKDKFVEFFIDQYKYKAFNWSTIDRVKDIAKKNFRWNGKKTERARKFLAEMKRIWAEYNNGPFLDTKNKIDNHYKKLNKKNKENVIYFVHCREPEEIKKFKDVYRNSCITILLKRDDRVVPNNHADMGVNNYDYDKIINNNGNEVDLRMEATKFIDYIRELKTK